MNIEPTDLPGVLIITPRVFKDARGFFFESYNADKFKAHGIDTVFVQDNHSHSTRGTLRGLHFQLPPMAQDKLVRCVRGASGTWRWTSASARPPSAAGSASS